MISRNFVKIFRSASSLLSWFVGKTSAVSTKVELRISLKPQFPWLYGEVGRPFWMSWDSWCLCRCGAEGRMMRLWRWEKQNDGMLWAMLVFFSDDFLKSWKFFCFPTDDNAHGVNLSWRNPFFGGSNVPPSHKRLIGYGNSGTRRIPVVCALQALRWRRIRSCFGGMVE